MTGFRWVPASLSQRSMPSDGLHAGTDEDGSELYVGRAFHQGEVIPAKIIPSKNACYISYDGVELLMDEFEMLVPARFSWQWASNGMIPPFAVEAGTAANGETLFIGRVTHDGCVTPGKVHPSHGNCYYPFAGEERHSPEYEVLVLC